MDDEKKESSGVISPEPEDPPPPETDRKSQATDFLSAATDSTEDFTKMINPSLSWQERTGKLNMPTINSVFSMIRWRLMIFAVVSKKADVIILFQNPMWIF